MPVFLIWLHGLCLFSILFENVVIKTNAYGIIIYFRLLFSFFVKYLDNEIWDY